MVIRCKNRSSSVMDGRDPIQDLLRPFRKDGLWRARRKNLVLRNDLLISIEVARRIVETKWRSSSYTFKQQEELKFLIWLRWTTLTWNLCQLWPTPIGTRLGISAHGLFTSNEAAVVRRVSRLHWKNVISIISVLSWIGYPGHFVSMMMPCIMMEHQLLSIRTYRAHNYG